MSGGEPGDDRSEEREVKLAVPDNFALPPWEQLAPASVEDRGERELRSVYWDTDDLALARAHLGLRHRNGVWTFKGPSRRDGDSVVREEREMRASPHRVPAELAQRVVTVAQPESLHPVAELTNRRRTVIISHGAESVELVHDRVTVWRGADEVSRFVEVEVEFTDPSAALAARVVRLLGERGASVSGVGKYSRALHALGFDVPDATAARPPDGNRDDGD